MKSLHEYIKESILGSTGAGASSIILSSVIKYLKDIKDGGPQHGGRGPEVIDLYIPGSSRETRLNEVFKFWFPRSKHNTKIKQLMKAFQKSGYKSQYDAGNDWISSFDFRLSKVQDLVYYCPLENHLNIYWDNRVIKVGEAYLIFSFVKYPQTGTTTLYVYALNQDRTISRKLTDEIKKSLL
jgi:hypothetical protein